MLKKTIISVLCLSVLATGYRKAEVLATNLPAYEETVTEDGTANILDGLVEKDGDYYYYENGEMVTNKWVLSDDNKYYFKKDGRAAVANHKIEGKYYVFNSQGQLLQPESKEIASIEIDGEIEKYYVNSDGTAASGWTKDRKYYCYENGSVAKGIIVIGEKFYCFSQVGKYNRPKTKKVRKAARYEKPFANLKKFLGKPNKIKYYKSCYGNGKDGVLSYDNFVVYTFKPAKGKEIFMGVE